MFCCSVQALAHTLKRWGIWQSALEFTGKRCKYQHPAMNLAAATYNVNSLATTIFSPEIRGLTVMTALKAFFLEALAFMYPTQGIPGCPVPF
eukprot:6434762-Pyramimonas_sp.AAC.1